MGTDSSVPAGAEIFHRRERPWTEQSVPIFMTLSALSRKAAFIYPIGRPPRTAVLGPWFRATSVVLVFPTGWSAEAAAYALPSS